MIGNARSECPRCLEWVGKTEWPMIPVGFSRFQRQTWSPAGWFTEEKFSIAAQAWRNREAPGAVADAMGSVDLNHDVIPFMPSV